MDSRRTWGSEVLKRTVHESSFQAVDQWGNPHTLHVYLDIIDAGTQDEPDAELEGLRSLETASGDAVNRLDKGRYQVVANGLILTSGEPDAL
jgi:hypothetical protein